MPSKLQEWLDIPPGTILQHLPTGPWRSLSEEESYILLHTLVVATGTWALLFLTLRLSILSRVSFDFCNRAVSQVHVVIALALSTRALNWSDPLGNFGGRNTLPQVQAMVISLSYFLYDFICCMFDVTFDWANAFHHVFSIAGFAFGLISGRCGEELMACLWLVELSNPFMHAREMLRELDAPKSALTFAVDLAFLISFTIARMVVGPVVTWQTVIGTSPTAVKVGAVAIQAVSTFWFSKILNAIFRMIRQKPKRS
ncbi:unnamed protein product [Closterium sp. Yama58-4]|nr:unnamed protein product [Closterium sp. Yama58-4]